MRARSWSTYKGSPSVKLRRSQNQELHLSAGWGTVIGAWVATGEARPAAGAQFVVASERVIPYQTRSKFNVSYTKSEDIEVELDEDNANSEGGG